jgi:bifunctional DNase/RNase
MPPRPAALLLVVLAIACGGAPPAATEAEVEVRVKALAIDRTSGGPVLILGEVGGKRELPIWIGAVAARSIAAELEAVHPARPNTHDLAARLLERLHGRLERVVVTDLRSGVYFAELRVASEGRAIGIDARPSDAIAIALRAGAPIYVRDPVFAQSALSERGPKPPRGPASPHRQEGVLSL